MTNVYDKKVLIGNYYEERFAPVQLMKEEPDFRSIRDKDTGIYVNAHFGQLKNLPRTKRTHAWNTQGVIADDNFRLYESETETIYNTNNIEFIKSKKPYRVTKMVFGPHQKDFTKSVQIQGKTDFKMLEQVNIYQNSVERPVDTSDKFQNILNHKQPQKQSFETTNQAYLGTNFLKKERKSNSVMRAAGTILRPIEDQGCRITSIICGERYRVSDEPKDNIYNQRSWVISKDKALQYADKNYKIFQDQGKNQDINVTLNQYRKSMRQVLPYDIATSLPIQSIKN